MFIIGKTLVNLMKYLTVKKDNLKTIINNLNKNKDYHSICIDDQKS